MRATSFLLLTLALTSIAPAAAAQPTSTAPRVFVAKLQAGAGATPGEASILNDSLLVAMKRFDHEFEIRTSQDIEGVTKLEVAQAMTGCDVVSCAAEIGDALGAEQLITGQLGHVGETWILSLTRTERATLKALSRTQVRVVGKAPDVLFPYIDKQAAEVLGKAATTVQTNVPANESAPSALAPAAETGEGGPSFPLLIGGVVAIGAGVLLGAVAAGLYWASWDQYATAQDAPSLDAFENAKGTGQVLYWGFVAATATASVAAIAGVGGLGAAFVLGE